MSQTSLHDRLNQLPLILAGPILRRTEAEAVTVWVALQQACEVTLKVYATAGGQGSVIQEQRLEGIRSTIAIGTHLHIVAVTAKPLQDTQLESNQIYAYDLSLYPLPPSGTPLPSLGVRADGTGTQQTLQQALISAIVPDAPISYFDHQLPTFTLPPTELNHLNIVHGSCRKLHGKGYDALPILDELLQENAEFCDRRPHQLFLTGDQIYGDDVADPLLWALTDAGDTLLGWEEFLPIRQPTTTGETHWTAKQLKPGHRSTVAEVQGGFTAGLHNQAEYAKSHLFSLGEYCAIYLFAWSPVLWSTPFPKGREVTQTSKHAKRWNQELQELQTVAQTLWKVRRSLANIPTYMIFDDHDISDDWNLNQAWCLRVLGKPLGRRVVQNGLLAYALFQAWGNTPDQFQDGQPGHYLLQAAVDWSASAGMEVAAGAAIARYLGLPAPDPLTKLPQLRSDEEVLVLDRDPLALTWHYTVRSTCHEVVVLDTRTWRGYPTADRATAPAMLLSPSAFNQQLRQPLQQTELPKQDGIPHSPLPTPHSPDLPYSKSLQQKCPSTPQATFVIAPTNLVSLQVIDWIQTWNLKQHKVYNNDVGDAWNIHKAAFAKLLSTLFEQRNQVIVLSGDIHYGSVVRLDYWTCDPNLCKGAVVDHDSPIQRQDFHPTTAPIRYETRILTQLTSSAIKNSELKTQIVHTKLKSLLPERDRHWIGWNNPLTEQEISTPKKFLSYIASKSRSSQPPLIRGAKGEPPDWHYHIHWIQRQSARTPLWGRSVVWLTPSNRQRFKWLHKLIHWIKQLWQNRWLQDGKEVVGLNNLGLIHFGDSPSSTHPPQNQPIVIQDLYWYAPWKRNRIVFSRFQVSLQQREER